MLSSQINATISKVTLSLGTETFVLEGSRTRNDALYTARKVVCPTITIRRSAKSPNANLRSNTTIDLTKDSASTLLSTKAKLKTLLD